MRTVRPMEDGEAPGPVFAFPLRLLEWPLMLKLDDDVVPVTPQYELWNTSAG